MYYLDNCATTKPYDLVVENMLKALTTSYGNPSSLHNLGIDAERMIQGSRKVIADILKAKANEITFTSGATESNNFAILGFLKRNKRIGNHIITSPIEHPSVMEALEEAKKLGFIVSFMKVDNRGLVDLADLEEQITEKTLLVSMMHVNNETGIIQPIEAIKSIMQRKGSKGAFHVDAVQSFCKLKINPKKLGIDLMTISSHKIHGPKGIGAIFINEKLKIDPYIVGGGQEAGVRSGTENVPGIYGFATAAQIAFEKISTSFKNAEKCKAILTNAFDVSDLYHINHSQEGCSPYILNISFPGIRSEIILHHLEAEGIYVSSGSACSNRKNSKSHVLLAMKLPPEAIDSSIRFSFGALNTPEEVDECSRKIVEIILKLAK